MSKKSSIDTEPSLAQIVSRSLSNVRKKDMPAQIPHLVSQNAQQIKEWAQELMMQSGPKVTTPDGFEKFFKSAKDVLGLLGTHGFKIPNPDVATPPIFSDVEGLNLPGGLLHERLLPQHFVYSGDASQIRLAKFLLAKIVFDGQPTNVLEALIKGDEHPIALALIALGMPAEVCEQVQTLGALKQSQSLASIPVHPLTKQIYFEEEGEDDVLLIPVTSEAMVIELQHQASFPANSARWLAQRKLCAIGGANPVNGGALCSDIGGAFQLLEASAPQTNDISLLSRLERGGRVYTAYSIPNSDVLSFVKLAGLVSETGNAGQRLKEVEAYEWFAHVLVTPLLDADELAATSVNTAGETDAIGSYLRRDRQIAVQVDMATAAALEILESVTKKQEKLRDHVSDARIREVLIEKMTEELM